uniref:Uncharacterized protein n=1 Tax=Cacopsylla melanoneura TaxID=428564 RepID=A0A8D8TAZ9_9HEMI
MVARKHRLHIELPQFDASGCTHGTLLPTTIAQSPKKYLSKKTQLRNVDVVKQDATMECRLPKRLQIKDVVQQDPTMEYRIAKSLRIKTLVQQFGTVECRIAKRLRLKTKKSSTTSWN